jgi:hypothetical protein
LQFLARSFKMSEDVVQKNLHLYMTTLLPSKDLHMGTIINRWFASGYTYSSLFAAPFPHARGPSCCVLSSHDSCSTLLLCASLRVLLGLSLGPYSGRLSLEHRLSRAAPLLLVKTPCVRACAQPLLEVMSGEMLLMVRCTFEPRREAKAISLLAN